LADVTLHHGWRTGAIIKELEVLEIWIHAFTLELLIVHNQ
jgi:hypothetical protein